jgi:hypothetical protein
MPDYIYIYLTIILLCYALFKTYIDRNKLAKNLIRYERIRTVLFLSRIKQRPLWIVICDDNTPLNESQVVSGVIDEIINGSRDEKRSPNRNMIGGQFTIHNNPTYFSMSDIREVGLTPIQSYNKKRGPSDLSYDEDTLNWLDHFAMKERGPGGIGFTYGPFDHYYKVIARL